MGSCFWGYRTLLLPFPGIKVGHIMMSSPLLLRIEWFIDAAMQGKWCVGKKRNDGFKNGID